MDFGKHHTVFFFFFLPRLMFSLASWSSLCPLLLLWHILEAEWDWLMSGTNMQRGWQDWKSSLWTVEWPVPVFSAPMALDWFTVPVRLVWFHSLGFPSRNDTEIARAFELEIYHAPPPPPHHHPFPWTIEVHWEQELFNNFLCTERQVQFLSSGWWFI